MSVIETADNMCPRTLDQGQLTTDSESLPVDDLHFPLHLALQVSASY